MSAAPSLTLFFLCSIPKPAFPFAAKFRNTTRMKPEPGLRILIYLLTKQARAEGFLVYQFADRYPEGIAQMANWIKEGKLKYREQIVEGFEKTPAALIGIFHGDNTGKMLVQVASPR